MPTRRSFLTRVAAASTLFRPLPGASGAAPEFDCEYLVVGSGAGGGTLAARLAEMGHQVLLIEAGGDPKKLPGTPPEDYEVPAFHPNASENEAMKWDFFVRHYADTERQKRDKKYYEVYDGDRVDGVLYPRAGTLGGCTAHSAMILVYPHNRDWQEIADATCDPSWAPDHMRQYFEKLENCHHRPIDRVLHALTRLNPARHGFGGWLHTEKALPLSALGDKDLIQAIHRGVEVALKELGNEGGQIVWAAPRW